MSSPERQASSGELRVEDTAAAFGHSSPVMEIIEFIRADAERPLCLPEREV